MTATLRNKAGTRWAVFDRWPNPVYRYALGIELPPNLLATKDTVAFLMANPSVAGQPDPKIPGELQLDPTVTRCCGFGKSWGYRQVIVANSCAFITPYPEVMEASKRKGVDVIGPENLAFLRRLRDKGATLVCAWGADPIASENARRVIPELGGEFWCLGTTAMGHPKHPLYLAGSTELHPWRPV